jgi:hypothetical protein
MEMDWKDVSYSIHLGRPHCWALSFKFNKEKDIDEVIQELINLKERLIKHKEERAIRHAKGEWWA